MAVTARIQVGIKVDHTGTMDLSTPKDPLNYSLSKTFANGTGADEVDTVFHDTRTLTTGASENLDLAGSLTDGFGSTITFAIVKAIFIYNKSTARILTVGGAASNQFINWVGDTTDVIKIRPGGFVLLVTPDATGYAVTAGTGDLLKILNDAGSSCDYDIVILGVSA